MKTTILAVALLCFAGAPALRAQCKSVDVDCVKGLALNFPALKDLEKNFEEVFDIRVSLHPEMGSKAKPGDPDVGWSAAFRSLFLDNLKARVDAKYSKTLSGQLQDEVMTPLRLTGVEFVPTYALTYEVSLGQFAKAWQQGRAGRNLKAARDLYYNEERRNLRIAYAEFEQSRAEFLEKAQKTLPDEVASSFHKMKIKAIAVLSMANFSGTALDEWLQAVYGHQ